MKPNVITPAVSSSKSPILFFDIHLPNKSLIVQAFTLSLCSSFSSYRWC